MNSDQPTEAKIAFEDDYKAEKKRSLGLEAEIELLKADKARYQSQISQLRKKMGDLESKEVNSASVDSKEANLASVPVVNTTQTPLSTSVFSSQNISPPPPVTPVPEELSPHKFHAWEAGCTTCGIPNPQFKPEMKCDPKKGGCGGILGSFETALQMKNCPHCLKSVEAAPNNEEGLKKAMQFLKTPRITV